MADSARVLSIEELAEFARRVQRFSRPIRELRSVTDLEIRATLRQLGDWIERCHRTMEKAQDELEAACRDLSSCRSSDNKSLRAAEARVSAARDRLGRAEGRLAEARRWFGVVEQAAADFAPVSHRMGQLAEGHTQKSISYLQQCVSNLESYMAIRPPEVRAAPAAAQRDGQTFGDAVKSAAQCLASIENLSPDIWDSLTESQRLHALQEAENAIARKQGREPVPAAAFESDDPRYCGGYDPSNGAITINGRLLNSANRLEAIATIVHEGRHAYQFYAITHPGFHPDSSEVEAWKLNSQPGNYQAYEDVGPDLYRNQPLERDAFSFEEEVMNQYSSQNEDR